jgi:hypothetical protein
MSRVFYRNFVFFLLGKISVLVRMSISWPLHSKFFAYLAFLYFYPDFFGLELFWLISKIWKSKTAAPRGAKSADILAYCDAIMTRDLFCFPLYQMEVNFTQANSWLWLCVYRSVEAQMGYILHENQHWRRWKFQWQVRIVYFVPTSVILTN